MRNRIVVWGEDAEENKVLLAIALDADENKIHIWSIADRDCTEEFYNQMMADWREGKDLEFPGNTKHIIRELTMADSILPDDLKVEKSDVISRAQMEWHFAVLTAKLYRNFKNEMEEISDKVKRLEVFDIEVWDEMKNLWSNVQKQILDKNLFRDHIDSLRKKSDSIFEELKKLRESQKNETLEKSKEILDQFTEKIQVLAERLDSGGVIKNIFDDLVKIQNDIKGVDLLDRAHIRKLKVKLDHVFQAIKAKREAKSNQSSSHQWKDHVNQRMEGINQAIQRIEHSLGLDQKDIDFENKRIASTNGQLEAQIRVAKIKMIEERMRQKQEKLDELLKVREGLEKKQEKLQVKEEKEKEKQEVKRKVKIEEKKIKEKISQEIQQHQVELAGSEDKLLKAAEEIMESKKTIGNVNETSLAESDDLLLQNDIPGPADPDSDNQSQESFLEPQESKDTVAQDPDSDKSE
ncbi:MAG: hypothetical protein IPM48_05260 [Saprospiraceae bacterium]|nr:hypothetical protein [Saprospiraceae bacterium]